MKILLSFFFFLSFNIALHAQRDTEHWIAPYYASATGPYTFALYFSTDSTVPFNISIYNNNIVIGTVTVSKSNPQLFSVDPQYIRATAISDAAPPKTLGLYTKGDKPYFTSLRIYNFEHGEIVTAKGKAGIGKLFYAAPAPLLGVNLPLYNFTTGILATEDNTKVTISGYKNGVQFINYPNPPAVINITLNKGQSYLLAGDASIAANRLGFIGAKITADKPVTITNGNANGMFATANTSGYDLILDQSVPTERLGQEFAMVRSLSPFPSHDMEGGIIVATENNTQIFINGSVSAAATLNEGEHYRILDYQYVQQLGTSGHYNIYVKASKNVYLYQLLGSAGSQTGGYNYIPPLNCFLPKKIDEIGKINEMPSYNGSINLKLNILTQAGAVVNYTINGGAPITPTVAQGPFPLTGNTQWVTYAITGISGNITINSTKAVTAGINGGYSTAGYGGYFAGFSSVPVISKRSGECAPEMVLEVDDSYQSYQWNLNGNPIPGATSNVYSPTQGGNYTVSVTVENCTTTTLVYKVYSCVKETHKTVEICSSKKVIQPSFSSSAQTIVASTVTIVTPPSHGTAVVNSNGTITYTPNSSFTANDVLVYKFCGNDPEFTDCEKVTLTLSKTPFTSKDDVLESCQYGNNNFAVFNLTTADVTDFNPVTLEYFKSESDLNSNSNKIPDPTNYQSGNAFIYVKISNTDGCVAVAKIQLIAKPITESSILKNKFICIGDTTVLDAGTGYDSYQWNTGETTSSISNVGLGEFTVVLGKNGCYLTQHVKILKAPDPVIKEVEIKNNTATILAEGGTPPYKYSVDGNSNWQNSNIFTDLSRGQHTFYIKDVYNCTPIQVELTVPNLINAITPNGDNINDYLDYKELAYKENLQFVIYDRYGNKIFTGEKFNNFKWDGTRSGKKTETGTYWYHINWTEPNKEKTLVTYNGWILVKNRN